MREHHAETLGDRRHIGAQMQPVGRRRAIADQNAVEATGFVRKCESLEIIDLERAAFRAQLEIGGVAMGDQAREGNCLDIVPDGGGCLDA